MQNPGQVVILSVQNFTGAKGRIKHFPMSVGVQDTGSGRFSNTSSWVLKSGVTRTYFYFDDIGFTVPVQRASAFVCNGQPPICGGKFFNAAIRPNLFKFIDVP